MRSAAQLACISIFASTLFTATLALVASSSLSLRHQTPTSPYACLRSTPPDYFELVCLCLQVQQPAHRRLHQFRKQPNKSQAQTTALLVYRPAGAAHWSHALVSLPSSNCISEGLQRTGQPRRLQRRLICSAAGLGGCFGTPEQTVPR